MSHVVSRNRLSAVVMAEITSALAAPCTPVAVADALTVLRGCNGSGFTIPVHNPVTLTNNPTPFAFDANSQIGNIPAVTVSQAGNSLTIVIGGVATTYTPAVTLDSFVASGAYNATTNILTLTLSNGNTVDINLSTLLSDALGALTKCDNSPFNPNVDKIVTCSTIGSSFTSLAAGAQGVLGGTGGANTYVGADGLSHLLPAAPALGTGLSGLPVGSQGALGGSGTANQYIGADAQIHALPPAVVIPPTTNVLTVTQAAGFSSVVDGVSSVVPVPAGTVATVLGFDAAGNPTRQPASAFVSGAASVTTNVTALTQAGGLVSTVNGVSSTVPVPAGTVATVIGFDSAGNPTRQPASAFVSSVVPATTNVTALTQAGGLVSTVNGVTSTVAIPTGTVVQSIGFDASGNPVRGLASSPLASVAPPADAVTTGAIGTSSDAARADHAHPFVHVMGWSKTNGLQYTHNGNTQGIAVAAGTIVDIIGYNAAGQPVNQAASALIAAVSTATTHTTSITQGAGFVSTVNGVTSTIAVPAGTVAQFIGFDAGGAIVRGTVPAGLALTTTAPLNDGVAAVGTATTAARADHVHGFAHGLVFNQATGISYTHNGNAATVPVNAGTIVNLIGFDSTGAPVRQNGSSYNKFRVVQALVAGNNVITHNLALTNSAVIVDVRDDATGAWISARVIAETTNSTTINVGAAVTAARITIDG